MQARVTPHVLWWYIGAVHTTVGTGSSVYHANPMTLSLLHTYFTLTSFSTEELWEWDDCPQLSNVMSRTDMLYFLFSCLFSLQLYSTISSLKLALFHLVFALQVVSLHLCFSRPSTFSLDQYFLFAIGRGKLHWNVSVTKYKFNVLAPYAQGSQPDKTLFEKERSFRKPGKCAVQYD